MGKDEELTGERDSSENAGGVGGALQGNFI